jgi:hypothetical protein
MVGLLNAEKRKTVCLKGLQDCFIQRKNILHGTAENQKLQHRRRCWSAESA